MKHQSLLSFLFAIFLSCNVFAQSTILDPGFGNNGIAVFPNYYPYGYVHNLAIQSSKKILVSATTYDYFYSIYGTIRRLNANGNLDSSFGTNGVITRFGYLNSMVLQPDDKIAMLNTRQPHYDYPIDTIYVVRYLADGQPDPSFGTNGTYAYGKVYSDLSGSGLIRLSSGSFVVLGKQNAGSAFIKLSPSGVADANFGNSMGRLIVLNGHDGLVRNFVPTPDNKFIVATTYTKPNGATSSALITYTSIGKKDTNGPNQGLLFNNNTVTTNMSIGLIFQPDGKLVEFTEDKGNDILLRFNVDGTPDLTYGTNGKVIVGVAGTLIGRNLSLQPGNKLLISPTNSTKLKRYLPNGTVDNTLGIVDLGLVSAGNTYITDGDSILQAGFNDIDEYETDLVVSKYMPCNSCSSRQTQPLFITQKTMATTTQKTGVSVYPNPVTDWVNITGLQTKTINNISITNSEGRLLQTIKTQNTNYKLDVKNFAPGIYSITIIQNNGTGMSYKIVKQNK